MIEIQANLFIGSQDDYECRVRHEQGWRVVHACKEPYHRQALGYSGRAIRKAHPEYLIARRGHRLILNLIDADNPAFIPKQIIDEAVAFVHESLQAGQRVLVHCNQGESRGPTIGLVYLVAYTDLLPSASPEEAMQAFAKLYPLYSPAAGMRGFLRQHLASYRLKREEQRGK